MNDDPPSTPPADPQPDDERRRYESFTVRIWYRPGHGFYDRAEVQHLQSGGVTMARQVTSEWIRAAIDRGTEGSTAESGELD